MIWLRIFIIILILGVFTTLSYSIDLNDLDKIASGNVFDFYTDLDAEDVWFSQTSEKSFASGWLSQKDANVMDRLTRLSKWHYSVCCI